jgi:hypothetical protein
VYNNFYAKYDIPLFKENVDPVTRIPHWYTNQRFRLSVNIKKRVIEKVDFEPHWWFIQDRCPSAKSSPHNLAQ